MKTHCSSPVAALLPLLLLCTAVPTPQSHAQAPAAPGGAPMGRVERPKIDPAELKGVPTVSVADDLKELSSQVGKIVRLKFGYRTDKIAPSGGGVTFADVRCDYFKYSEKGTKSVTLLVPPEGAKWLAAVTTVATRSSSQSVYARVMSRGMFEAVGSEVKNTAKGLELVW